MSLWTITGWKETKAMDSTKLQQLRNSIGKLFPLVSEAKCDTVWARCKNSIGNVCENLWAAKQWVGLPSHFTQSVFACHHSMYIHCIGLPPIALSCFAPSYIRSLAHRNEQILPTTTLFTLFFPLPLSVIGNNWVGTPQNYIRQSVGKAWRRNIVLYKLEPRKTKLIINYKLL